MSEATALDAGVPAADVEENAATAAAPPIAPVAGLSGADIKQE